jgi:hypothetical protein
LRHGSSGSAKPRLGKAQPATSSRSWETRSIVDREEGPYEEPARPARSALRARRTRDAWGGRSPKNPDARGGQNPPEIKPREAVRPPRVQTKLNQALLRHRVT